MLVVGKQRCSLKLQFSANASVGLFATPHSSQLLIFAQADSLRSTLHKLEGLLKEYSPVMDKPTERALEVAIKCGIAFSDVSSPVWTAKDADTS